jgi:hypothetical protein
MLRGVRNIPGLVVQSAQLPPPLRKGHRGAMTNGEIASLRSQ